MLKEAKKALRITIDAYDDEIMRLLEAGARDLESAGVVLYGEVSCTIGTDDAVIDTSSLSDPLEKQAIITYAMMHFGNPPNYDRLLESYETQKCQLMHATGHTDWGEGK